MQPHRRVIACALVVVLFGPLAPSALAQQPAPPPVPPPQPAVVEVMPPEGQMVRGTDIYDVGAGVVTVAKAPFNVALCGLGTAMGTALFLITFGSAYKATTRVIEEGCAQRWIIRGDDLRPRGAPGVFHDQSSEMYQSRR
jgi:hypothetical protein